MKAVVWLLGSVVAEVKGQGSTGIDDLFISCLYVQSHSPLPRPLTPNLFLVILLFARGGAIQGRVDIQFFTA